MSISDDIGELMQQVDDQAQIIRELVGALEAASDHLDYVGYGDSWERECAYDQKLPERISAALSLVPEEYRG